MDGLIDMHGLRAIITGIFLLLTGWVWPLAAQDQSGSSLIQIREDANEKYGPSPELLNGEKYHYPYRSVRGNPFFELHGNPKAAIQIHGKLYEEQAVRYDIHNQLIVLDFKDRSGAPGAIVLRNEWVETFSLGGIVFKKYQGEHGSDRFGQVIYEGYYGCVYFWEKAYKPDVQNGRETYRFSDPMRQSYILIQNQFLPYTGRRSFLNCFPNRYKIPLKSHIKDNRIRIRKASDLVMQSLMAYINQLSDHED